MTEVDLHALTTITGGSRISEGCHYGRVLAELDSPGWENTYCVLQAAQKVFQGKNAPGQAQADAMLDAYRPGWREMRALRRAHGD